jgi:hypothetical protein
MTLATICNAALSSMAGFERPASFFGSTNPTAVQCVALLEEAGRSLERKHRWSALKKTHTFTTTATVDTYDLPSDFRAFANMSLWDRANERPLIGPAAGYEWQWLKSSIDAGAVIDRWFRVANGQLVIHPVPTVTGDTIAFDYYSKNWITKQLDGSYVAAFTADLDEPRLDDLLLQYDLKWRFLQAKGFPYEPEYKMWEDMLETLLADEGGKKVISLGGRRRADPLLGRIPDTGFGV